MSLADPTVDTISDHDLARPDPGRRGRSGFGRLLRSEVRLVFGRRRNQILLTVLGLVPLIIGTAVRLSNDGGSGDGPPFLNQITDNGLFLVFTALVVSLPLFLPLAVAIVSGCLLYTSPSPRDRQRSRMPSSA